MPELQPYRGGLTEAAARAGVSRSPAARRMVGGVSSMAKPALGKQQGCMMAAAVFGWWGLGVGLFLLLEFAGGRFIESLLGEDLGSVFTMVLPCVCFPLIFGGTVVVLVGRSWLMGLIVSRKLGSPSLWASAEEVLRGDVLDLTFGQDINSPTDIESVIIQLLLRETATYTSGTDTVTVTHDHVIGQVERPGRPMQKGFRLEERADFEIPPGAMHTFVANNNKLQWFVTVQVKIARWPDFYEFYHVTVLPQEAA
jgi:hypothetical protein